MLQPKVNPPQQTSSASIKIRQQGLTLRLKFFIFPPQQHRKRIINKIHVQLQPPFSQPSLQPSLNIPLNILSPPFAEKQSACKFDFQSLFHNMELTKIVLQQNVSYAVFFVRQSGEISNVFAARAFLRLHEQKMVALLAAAKFSKAAQADVFWRLCRGYVQVVVSR